MQLDGEMMEVQEIKKFPKPRKPDSESQNFQHVKILDCNEPVCRVICECWHCKQGILCEVDVSSSQYLEVECPSCGKTAVRLMAEKVISTTPIPSPWQGWVNFRFWILDFGFWMILVTDEIWTFTRLPKTQICRGLAVLNPYVLP